MLKRSFDFFLSFISLITLSPLFVFVSIWIKLDSPGPVFFTQIRVGHHGKLFKIHKFRTMSVGSEINGKLTVGSDKRITTSGHFLRKSKIDELPQLFDVFLGRMSLVGPRPEVPEYVECYDPKIRTKILSVRPGITDLASIHMVDENEILAKYADPKSAYIEIILPIKQAYYLDYVKNKSFINDILIIFKTLVKIISRF